MTKEEAIKLAESKFWEPLSDVERTRFQLFEEKLCMPFGVFHAAVEGALERPVQTLEFAFAGVLESEFIAKHGE